jgi:pimeloyl-ACP methyl ester carboxylesterase
MKNKFKIIICWFICGLVIFSAGCGWNDKIDIAKIKTQVARVGDIDIAYKTFGRGYPLIMIMGYSATMDMWDARVLKDLARRYKVIIFDNRGMGFSTASDKEFSIGLFAEDTAGLLRALNIKKANVLGYSMGTNIALELTLRYPEMANKLILYAGDCGGREFIEPTPENMQKLTDTSGATSERQKRLLGLLFPENWFENNPDFAGYLPRVTETYSLAIVDRQTKAMNGWEGCCSRLSAIKQPVLLITGTEDVLTPPENSKMMVNRIPLAWLVQFKGAGHGLMYQYPRQFSRALLTFLED